MQIASLSELKKELKTLTHEQILAVCLRLARYKKENKELLHYLLMESHDEPSYISLIKLDIQEQFETINDSNLYYAKKGIRRALRTAVKHVRYSGNKETEVEVLSFFCQNMIDMKIRIQDSKVLMNLLNNQIKKIEKAMSSLHEDLTYDHSQSLNRLKSQAENYFNQSHL